MQRCGDDSRAASGDARDRPSRSAGVTVELPPGWHGGAGEPDTHVTDPLARITASSAPVKRQPSQCFIAAYAPPADGVTIVVVEWDHTDGTPPPRPRRLTRELLPLRPGEIECFRGGGGSVHFTEHGRIFGAYVLLGEQAPSTLADDARSVLDTLRVASR